MSDELGSGSHIDVLLRTVISCATGNDDFIAKFVSKDWRFSVPDDKYK